MNNRYACYGCSWKAACVVQQTGCRQTIIICLLLTVDLIACYFSSLAICGARSHNVSLFFVVCFPLESRYRNGAMLLCWSFYGYFEGIRYLFSSNILISMITKCFPLNEEYIFYISWKINLSGFLTVIVDIMFSLIRGRSSVGEIKSSDQLLIFNNLLNFQEQY